MSNECHPLLAPLSEQYLTQLLQQSESRHFSKDEQIVRARDNDTNLYLINSGIVRVTLYSSEGKEVSFVDIPRGGNFGELSAIDNKPRSANVIALSDVNITIISPPVLMIILEKYPAVSIKLLGQLSAIVRRLCDRIFEYSTLEVPRRVHLELLRLGRESLGEDGVAEVINPPTQVEIANRLSCTREAVSREFKKLENMGIVSRQRKLLKINKMDVLEDMIDDLSIDV